MALTGDVVSDELIQGLVSQIDQLGLLIKGLGVVAVFWVAYTLVIFWLEKKKLEKINEMGEAVKRMERKIEGIKRVK